MTSADDVRRAAGLPDRSPALTVRCTHCGAQSGEECHGRTAKTRSRRREPHPARVAAAPNAVVIPSHHPQPDPPSAQQQPC